MMNRWLLLVCTILVLALLAGCQSAVAPAPLNAAYDWGGPPNAGELTQIGDDCYLPLDGIWAVTGDLEGTMAVDYDILIHGPCDPDGGPGDFDEDWIIAVDFEGLVGGREGTFEAFTVADITDKHLTGQMAIVPGSGTGKLVGLRGIIDIDEMTSDDAPWPLTGYYCFDTVPMP